MRKSIEKHIRYRLRSSPNEDAVIMALRLLVIRAVENVSDCDRKFTKTRTEESQSALLLSQALFSQVVNTVRHCTTGLQFASLFLEVGRQIEPSCLIHLFPLPLKGMSRNLLPEEMTAFSIDTTITIEEARTVMDMIALCIREGSLAASVSALPLLGSKRRARKYCEQLIQDSLMAFTRNSASSELVYFDCTEEERRILKDIFRFGLKLEEASDLEAKTGLSTSYRNITENLAAEMSTEGSEETDDFSRTGYSTSFSTVQSSPPRQSRQLICMGGRNSSILNYIVPAVFSASPSRYQEEEDAIRKAATSFIKQDLDPVVLLENSFSNMGFGDEPAESLKLEGVGGVVGRVLVEMLCSGTGTNTWRAMLCVARLLLEDSSEESVPWDSTFQTLLERVEAGDLEALVPLDLDSEDTGEERFIDFMIEHITDCRQETTAIEASRIVDLVKFLLQRLEEFPQQDDDDLAVVCAGLVVVGLIAGNVADRIPDLIAQANPTCVVRKWYKSVSSELAELLAAYQ